MSCVLLIVMTFLGAAGSYFLKKASGSASFAALLQNLNLYTGGALYFLSAVLNIAVLRKLDYSIVLPLTAVTYIWTMLIAHWFLDEPITRKKVIGVSCIAAGAILLSAGG
ncbi:MAG: EamA family transporter [Pyramidobacter sp.]|jgi:drug/metabolite transporter (DMT)-like permease